MWRARVCHHVYLCAGRCLLRLCCTRRGGGAEHAALCRLVRRSLDAAVRCAEGADAFCLAYLPHVAFSRLAPLCAPLTLQAKDPSRVVAAPLLLLVLPQGSRWHRPRPAANHLRHGERRKMAAVRGRVLAAPADPRCSARRRAAGGRRPRLCRRRRTPTRAGRSAAAAATAQYAAPPSSRRVCCAPFAAARM